MATEGSSSGSSYLRVRSVFGSTKELRSAVARACLAIGHGYRASEKRGWATEEVLVLRGGRYTETRAGSVAGSCGASGGVLGLHGGGARDGVGP